MDLDIDLEKVVGKIADFNIIEKYYSSDNIVKRQAQKIFSEMPEDEYNDFMTILKSIEFFVINNINKPVRCVYFSDIRKKTPTITIEEFNKIMFKYDILFKALGYVNDYTFNMVNIEFSERKLDKDKK